MSCLNAIRSRVGVLMLAGLALVLSACSWSGGTKTDTSASPPQSVRMTYFGISNWTFQIGDLNILMDGYMTRIPKENFYGGGGGLGFTKESSAIDRTAVDRMNATLALGSTRPINLIITGHSHFDHSFDTPYWARLTGARVIGPQTSCYQVEAFGIPASQCTAVNGGETIKLNDYVTVRVVRWNHSGTHATNPEQHDPAELTSIPKLDAKGNLRGGVAEDFPNGGGNRGYLFIVNTGAAKPLTIFVTNSGSPTDLADDIPVDGVRYGSPLDSLRKTMVDSGLQGVDLWIGAGGAPVAALTLPILKPRAFIPNHLGNFFTPFEAGLTPAFNDAALVDYLSKQGVPLTPPKQYLDAWTLDAKGLHEVPDTVMKAKYGLQ